jgi:hypothetical protein
MSSPSFNREAIEAEIDRIRLPSQSVVHDVSLVPAAGLHQRPYRAVPLLAYPGAGIWGA